jgi:predicted phage terminase large subunit-like protein
MTAAHLPLRPVAAWGEAAAPSIDESSARARANFCGAFRIRRLPSTSSDRHRLWAAVGVPVAEPLAPAARGGAPPGVPAGRTLGPQPGFQTKFLSSRADITIGGGAAGCGKSFAEMLAAARHKDVPGFSAVFFRRSIPDITNPGSLWDESYKVFPLLGAKPVKQTHEWIWPRGAKVKMSHLEHDSTVLDWKGAQVPLFIFDELTSFTAAQFWYMLSRNRSTCGVRPYIIATTNPEADSWVADLIAWWIDQDEYLADGAPNPRYGFPIPERSGKLRYFTRLGDEMVWGDTAEQVLENLDVRAGVEEAMREAELSYEEAVAALIKSLTFIPGKLKENKILERSNPGYRGSLMAMTRVERAVLLDGNWKAKASAGDYFKRHEVTMLETEPDDVVEWVRSWDLAATEPSDNNKKPDWTCGVKMGRRKSGRLVVAHAEFAQVRSDPVAELIVATANTDGVDVKIRLPEDPGQAGKHQSKDYSKMLNGFDFAFERETGPKETRANPFARQWQHGNVDVVRGKWNAQYFAQMEGFPSKAVKDDAVDASSGAHKALMEDSRPSWADVL